MLVLHTERLSLRDPIISDVEALASYQSHELYLQHYDQPPNTQKIIELAISWVSQTPRKNFQLIVELTGDNEVIGCAGLRQDGYPECEAEIGLEFHPDYWGKGYATESLIALIELARSRGISNVHALTDVSNARAIRLTKKVGFEPVGVSHEIARFCLSLVG
ncbi:MAG: ribosomal-protein-alanine N-acetyltransferase [Candidatus Azotimanducaceae bacterium]|jgi:ribosomal-protein-alanine N-acetyltransferase